jgi:predicted anti-sigma-YlaC factor YlaD
MKISCEVFDDLMPLVKDGIASEQSNELLKEHMKECEKCKKVFEDPPKELQYRNEPRVIKLKLTLFAAISIIIIGGNAIGYYAANVNTPMPITLIIASFLSLAVFALLLFKGGITMKKFWYGKAIGTIILFGLIGVYLLLHNVFGLF